MIIVLSQDKETLGRYAEIKIDEGIIKGISAYGTMSVLGVYKSRERAMTILDKINKCIVDGMQKDYLDRKYRVKQELVFYMPQK